MEIEKKSEYTFLKKHLGIDSFYEVQEDRDRTVKEEVYLMIGPLSICSHKEEISLSTSLLKFFKGLLLLLAFSFIVVLSLLLLLQELIKKTAIRF